MSIPEFDKLCLNEDKTNGTTQSDKTNQNTEVLRICFNGYAVIEVDRKKLLQKSLYFQAISNPSFNDHEKDNLGVNFDASFEVFQQVVNYIETDEIKRKNDHVLEIFELATYLQIDSLIEKCKDIFIYNLNTRTLYGQLKRIKNNPLLKDFEDVALKFKKSGKPSISGLYILKKLEDGKVFMHLQSPVNEESDCKPSPVYFKGDYRQEIDVMRFVFLPKIVGRFHNSLIISDSSSYLYQYNLITGITVDLEVLGMQKVCLNDEKVFAVGSVDHYNDLKLKVSVLSSDNCDEQLKVTKTKVFESIEVVSFLGVFYCNEKIYIMYTTNKSVHHTFAFKPDTNLGKHLNFVRLVILCAKTLKVLRRFKIKDIIHDEENLKEDVYSQNHEGFKTIYHDKKNSKVFIYTGCETPILVFDTKKENFYFVKNTLVASSNDAEWPEYFFTEYNYNKVYKVVGVFIPNSFEKNYIVSDYEYVDEKFICTSYECKLDNLNGFRDLGIFYV